MPRLLHVLLPNQQKLHDYFDIIEGRFIWRLDRRNRAKAGQPAGTFNESKKIIILTIDGQKYAASTIAWKYWYGEDPATVVKFIDKDRLNFRKENLKLVNQATSQWFGC